VSLIGSNGRTHFPAGVGEGVGTVGVGDVSSSGSTLSGSSKNLIHYENVISALTKTVSNLNLHVMLVSLLEHPTIPLCILCATPVKTFWIYVCPLSPVHKRKLDGWPYGGEGGMKEGRKEGGREE